MFKDKLFLVMLVLGLLTIVAAAGVVTTQRGSGQEQNPYVDMQEQGDFIAQQPGKQIQEAELPERNPALAEETEIAAEQLAENNLDTVTGKCAGGRNRAGKCGSPGSEFFGYQQPVLAGERECSSELQYGFYDLFSNPGSVQVQSRHGDSGGYQ